MPETRLEPETAGLPPLEADGVRAPVVRVAADSTFRLVPGR